MVNVCGKCKHYLKSETDRDGNFFHYCGKVDEIQPPVKNGEISKIPTLKVNFNDGVCQYYEKEENNKNTYLTAESTIPNYWRIMKNGCEYLTTSQVCSELILLTETVEQQQKEINTLTSELDSIKTTIINQYNNERTMLGKSLFKQLLDGLGVYCE